MVSIVIPVFNEKGRLENLIKHLKRFDEVIIIDDGSSQPVSTYIYTSNYPNLVLLTNDQNRGYLFSIRRGIEKAKGKIVVTMDGDGEHKHSDIEKLISPIEKGECDIVFGKRPSIARPSERFLLWMARLITGETVEDSGTGFRAIRSEYAKSLKFFGGCTCGSLLMECHDLGMRICEVDVDLPVVDKPRRIAWDHLSQFFTLVKYFLQTRIKGLDE